MMKNHIINQFSEKKPSINNSTLTLHLDNYLIASSASSHEGQHVRAKECSAAKRKSQLEFKFNTVICTLLLSLKGNKAKEREEKARSL